VICLRQVDRPGHGFSARAAARIQHRHEWAVRQVEGPRLAKQRGDASILYAGRDLLHLVEARLHFAVDLIHGAPANAVVGVVQQQESPGEPQEWLRIIAALQVSQRTEGLRPALQLHLRASIGLLQRSARRQDAR
jgi:hypothetical protein